MLIMCFIITIKIFIIIEINKPYKPIFKSDNKNKKIVLIITPTKLSYIDILALPHASIKEDKTDSKEKRINMGLKKRKYDIPSVVL